mgnify:CR=1 FL=1
MIELLNLTKRYGKTGAIDDVSLSIAAGAVVGIVGKTGDTGTNPVLTCKFVGLNEF